MGSNKTHNLRQIEIIYAWSHSRLGSCGNRCHFDDNAVEFDPVAHLLELEGFDNLSVYRSEAIAAEIAIIARKVSSEGSALTE